MRPSLLTRATLISSAATALVVAAAAPGTAASSTRNIYKASLKSTGSVAADFAASLEDYVSGTPHDRLFAVATRSAPLTIHNAGSDGSQTTCKTGSVQLYGQGIDWSNAADGVSGAVLQVDCTYPNGSKHRFFWGTEHYGAGWAFRPSTYCLQLTRVTTQASPSSPGTTRYDVTTQRVDGAPCPAQEQTLDSTGNVLHSTATGSLRSMPFEATFTVSGRVPTTTR